MTVGSTLDWDSGVLRSVLGSATDMTLGKSLHFSFPVCKMGIMIGTSFVKSFESYRRKVLCKN